MLRKKTKKSNSPCIGIFSGKSTYNEAILEALYNLNKATAWVIADYLLGKINPKTDKEPRGPGTAIYYRLQKIYGVIQRKGGRLNDLEEKGYIKQNEGLWELTTKGHIALTIKKPEILERENKSQLIETFRESVNTMPDDVAKLPLGISVNQPELKRGINSLLDNIKNNPQVFKIVRDETKELLHDGIDLDRVDEHTLISLLSNRKNIRKLFQSLTNGK